MLCVVVADDPPQLGLSQIAGSQSNPPVFGRDRMEAVVRLRDRVDWRPHAQKLFDLPAYTAHQTPAAVSPDIKTLRARAGRGFHQLEFRRMGQRVRRREDDFSAARPSDRSLRDYRNRQPQLALSQLRRAPTQRTGVIVLKVKQIGAIRTGATR